MLSVQTNITAMQAAGNLNNTTNELSQSIERLSSGYRINSAADDAAGLSISEQLTSQTNGLNQAQSNAQDAINLVQTADGSLTDIQNMLQRVRELGVEFNNGTLSSSDKAAITNEVSQLQAEISRVGGSTQFNNINLLTGSATLTFQVGANSGDTIAVTLSQVYGTGGSGDAVDSSIFDFSSGTANLASIDAAISQVSTMQSTFGAVQNRLNDTLSNLGVFEQNLSSSLSDIMDTDVASETTQFSKEQILQQAGTAMLAQAEQIPSAALKLLGG